MIALLARRLALTFLLALAVVALIEQFNPAPPELLMAFHRADYRRCVTIHNGPLIQRSTQRYPRRSDQA